MERKIELVNHTPKMQKLRRVAAYARVSSGKDAMLHSLSAQVSYYSELIQKHSDWQYVGVYADEAVTGTKDTRPEFDRLINDCRNGKVDYILTKSISRFARNTVTLLSIVREVRDAGIGIYFEGQRIDTLTVEGEFLLTVLASYAQEESRSVSENCKWRARKGFEKGVPYACEMLGYRLVNGKITVIPEEAEIFFYVLAGITLLFEKIFYLSRKISYRCPSCKEDYLIPIYACSNPACNMKHRRLRPGFYGVFKRKCVCGTKIPLTAKSSGYYWEKDISTPNTFIKHKFKFSDMNSYCPKCGVEHNAGLSKPTSIALIGGKSAGKTTFKVAFTYQFLEEELTKNGIDFDFPDKQSDDEYENSKRYFRGQDIIPGTNRGVDYDIATFSFFLKHKKFDAARMIHVYDMPGEVFESGDAQEGWRNYRFSEGMVFLIDPYSLPMVRDLHTNEIKAMGVCEMQMNVLVDSLVNTLQNEKVKKSKGKFKIPVALTLNKVDSPILKKMCGGEAVESLMSNLPDVFGDYFTTIDYVCRCFISRNGGMGFIANLDNNFETVHFFFSSPMGYIPQYSRTCFKPINVLPVMQWMMLKADKQLARVWKPEMPVLDVNEEQKQLYQTHPEYYEQFVVPLLDTIVQQQVQV